MATKKPTGTAEQRAIAEAIVADLFVNGMGQEASRLVLWDDATKRDLGGWCRAAVVDRIVEALARKDVA